MKMKKQGMTLWIGVGALAAFVVWTLLLGTVDVRAIGPCDSSVGFATLNGWVHEKTGVNWALYVLTDWMGLVPFAVAFGFAGMGFVQWVRRKRILAVDRSILVLGVFYAVVGVLYLAFEVLSVNYRPVLIEGVLEASYPSSTTVLVSCILPTAMLQWRTRIQNKGVRRLVLTLCALFVAFTVIARLLSGVHWVSDIIGGALLSAGLVALYAYASGIRS